MLVYGTFSRTLPLRIVLGITKLRTTSFTTASFLTVPNAVRISTYLYIYIYIYTGCNRRNGPNFERVFLRSNYTDITENTHIQSSMVTEILAREKSGLLWCLRTVLYP